MREEVKRRQQARIDQGLCIVCDKKIKGFDPFDKDAIRMCIDCEIRLDPHSEDET